MDLQKQSRVATLSLSENRENTGRARVVLSLSSHA